MKEINKSRIRSAQLLIRLSDEEIARVRRAAKRADQPVSWWVRRVLSEAVKVDFQP